MVDDWKVLKPERNKHFYYGIGWGADFNGFHKAGAARKDNAANPVVYPFKSWDGKQTLAKLTTGEHTWDVNTDGVANYGLYPDWLADIRNIAGDEIVKDFGRGAESYIQMWERAVGVPAYRPVSSRSIFTTKGLFRIKLGVRNEALLRSAGQPRRRGPFVWNWGIQRRPIKNGSVYAVIARNGRASLIASTGLEHSALAVNVGDRASLVRGARRLGSHLRYVAQGQGTHRAYVFGVRGGKVRFTGVTTLGPKALRRAVARLPAKVR